MEGNMSSGNMLRGNSYGVLDLQGSMHIHHPHIALHQKQQQQQLLQQQQPHPSNHQDPMAVHPQAQLHDVFPLSVGHVHETDQPQTLHMVDYGKGSGDYGKGGDRGKTSTSDDDEPSFNTEDGIESAKGKKASQWHRMKWTDAMVKLLITVVSYMGEDTASECGSSGKRKFALLQKKGKWKSVSNVMAERGCYVSPQQCEDKFNDLNKRYKRLNDVLGRGTSCKVVENPALLEVMDHLSEKAKEDVRKILSSKHLFYEEMCSYHNGNRLHLPADPALQRSLQLALGSRDEHDIRKTSQDALDEDDQDAETDDRDDDAEEDNTLHTDVARSCFPKRIKQGLDVEEASFGITPASQDCNRLHTQANFVDMNQALPEGSKTAWLQSQWMKSRTLQLEEQRLHIQVQMLELEKQRFKWQRFSKKKDRELEKLRMENEKMKLENERMILELKRKELDVELQ